MFQYGTVGSIMIDVCGRQPLSSYPGNVAPLDVICLYTNHKYTDEPAVGLVVLRSESGMFLILDVEAFRVDMRHVAVQTRMHTTVPRRLFVCAFT